MKFNLIKIIFLSMLASPLFAMEHDHIDKDRIGEYYEFDLVGTRRDKIKRELGFHSKRAFKAPFKLTATCYRHTRQGLQSALHSVEMFLSDSRTINGNRRAYKNAVSEFEESAMVHNYYAHDLEHQDSSCMFGLPQGLWRLFKSTLYTAGFRLPRATWHTIKSIFHGTCDCLNI